MSEDTPQPKPARKNQLTDLHLIENITDIVSTGQSLLDAAKLLKIPYSTVKRVAATELAHKMLSAKHIKQKGASLNYIQREMFRLTKKAVAVLEACLDDNDLEAAKIVFKAQGALEAEPVQTQATQIVIKGFGIETDRSKTIEVVPEGEKSGEEY